MGKPQSNGLFEVAGTKEPIERGFFCMKLVSFLNKEVDMGTEQYGILWEQRFDEAKKGNAHTANNAQYMPKRKNALCN